MKDCSFVMCVCWSEDSEHRSKGGCVDDYRKTCKHYRNHQKAVRKLNQLRKRTEKGTLDFYAIEKIIALIEGNET